MSWNKTHSKSLEEKVKRLKEANSELRKQIKLLQQHKSCYDCKHWFPNKASYPCNQCSMAINCLFEPKEQ